MEGTAPDSFRQEVLTQDNLVLWRISGNLNLPHYEELKSELGRLIENKTRNVVLDLQGLESIDSRGLGFLITVQREVRGIQGRLVLVHLAARFAPLFETTRLNRIFEIFLDLESAKRSFGAVQPGAGESVAP